MSDQITPAGREVVEARRERDEARAEVERLQAKLAAFEAMARRYIKAAEMDDDANRSHTYRMHAESIQMVLDGFVR